MRVAGLLLSIILSMNVPSRPSGSSNGGGQRSARHGQPPWQEALKSASKSTRIPVSDKILKEVQADPQDCYPASLDETLRLDAYRLTRPVVLIVVWGRSSCDCSPTGNCDFWIYRVSRGGFQQILETNRVREFNFLRAQTNGLPDLVIRSHDSAQRFPGALWKFDGAAYIPQCGGKL
jgi:hypothetical protein